MDEFDRKVIEGLSRFGVKLVGAYKGYNNRVAMKCSASHQWTGKIADVFVYRSCPTCKMLADQCRPPPALWPPVLSEETKARMRLQIRASVMLG